MIDYFFSLEMTIEHYTMPSPKIALLLIALSNENNE